MIRIEQHLKNKIAAVEAFSADELEAAKKELPRDYDVLSEVASRIIKEFAFLVDAALVEGLRGNTEQSVLYHKLSFQCLQINGMLMEQARGEEINEYYLTARKHK